MAIPTRLACVGLVVFGPILFCCAQDDARALPNADLLARLQREAPRDWAKYHEALRPLCMRTYEVYDVFPGAKGITETRIGEAHRYRQCWVSIQRRMTFDPYLGEITPEAIDAKGIVAEEQARCSNPSYYFEIKRRSPSAPWQVDKLYSAKLNPSEFAAKTGDPTKVGSVELMIGTESLPELLSKPSFVIDRLISDGAHVVVGFTYDRGTNEARNTVASGTIRLDPGYYWLVTEATLEHATLGTNPTRYTEIRRFAYGDDVSGSLRSPVYFTMERKSTTDPTDNFVSKYCFKLSVSDDYRRDSDYTLAAFGLTEPDWARRSTPWYWFALIAGILAIVAVLGWRRWKSGLAQR